MFGQILKAPCYTFGNFTWGHGPLLENGPLAINLRIKRPASHVKQHGRTNGRTKGWTSGKDGQTDEACAVTCALQLFWNVLQNEVKCPFSVQIDR